MTPSSGPRLNGPSIQAAVVDAFRRDERRRRLLEDAKREAAAEQAKAKRMKRNRNR